MDKGTLNTSHPQFQPDFVSVLPKEDEVKDPSFNFFRYVLFIIRFYFANKRLLRLGRLYLEQKINVAAMQTVIDSGYTNEKEFAIRMKQLTTNRKKQSDPTKDKAVNEVIHRLNKDWKPKRRFKDSKNPQAMREGQERSEYVRVLKNRPLVKNPDDLMTPPNSVSNTNGV